jgi:hypothetical protein
MVTIKRKLISLAIAGFLVLSSCYNPWMADLLNNEKKSSRPTPPNPRAVAVADSINSYSGGEGLNATVSGSVVTVTGDVSGASSSLQLDIPAGVTVRFLALLQADYGANCDLIELSGSGTLEITNHSDINIDGYGNGIKITGGSPTLIISPGGIVVSSGSSPISVIGGSPTIVISGGLFASYNGGFPYIALYNCGGTITVSGTPTFQGNGTQRIYRDSTATIIGYYSNNTTKAYFDGGWTDENLRPMP